MPSSFTRSRSGMALLNVILLVILIGGLVIAGYKLMGPIIQRGKINDTKTIINGNVDAIISWTVTNCRIPDALGGIYDFTKVAQNPNDAWGNRLAYLYEPELANNSSCAQICGMASTNLSVKAGATTTPNVAFVIASSQYSGTFHNLLLSGTVFSGTTLSADTAVSTSGWVNGTLSQQFTDPPDIVRIVPLNELKARIGCAGYTWGQLRILNNELPKVCSSASNYSAQLFPDGGSPAYGWDLSAADKSAGWSIPSGLLTKNSLPADGSTVTIILSDTQNPPVQRTYTIRHTTCGIPPGTIPPGTPPDPPVQPPTNPGFDTSDPNLIEFGLDNNDTSACFWYPQNLPLLGKTMRAYWNFCYKANDTSTTSTTYADGYTFSLMQANNPTSYCGTGSTYNAVTNPRFDCSSMGGLGEYLAYCGLPGNSLALEFDIYPSGGRNDPTGSYNHLAVIRSTSTHNAGAPAGLFGDNTHGVGGNPACTIASTGCLYDNKTGHTYPVTWLENTGCNANYDNHNTRVEIHTRCNNDCSQCETNSCTTKALLKVWIDRGNGDITSDDATTPDMSYCTDLPTALNQYKVGFTEATGGAHQWGYIKNFNLRSLGACPLATITPDTLPAGTVGTPYSATMSASGGTLPYANWSWGATNIPGVTASNLPPGLSMSAAGVISGTPTTAGSYNTVLISVDDACTADTCTNKVSKSYTITINPAPVPTCTLTANPTVVTYNSTTNFTWTIANGPANISWSIAPGGTCTNTSNSTGGTCTSGNLTTPGTTIYTLTVSNAGGSSSCSATVNVGCQNYRVWNTTGNTYDFSVNGACRNNVNNNSEITNNANRLNPGQNLIRLTNSGTCGGSTIGQISYNNAMNADISANGGDGLCDVNYTSSDTVINR